MTQLLPIALIAIMLLSDSESLESLRVPVSPAASGLYTLAGYAVIIIVALTVVSSLLRRADRGRVAPLMRADRVLRLSVWAVVLVHAASVIAFGWLDTVRAAIGNLPGLDELLAIIPPCSAMLALWAVGYSVERRIRQATLIRHMDEGRPIHDIPSRRAYIIQQLRVQLLFLLVPLLLIVASGEVLEALGRGASQHWLQVALIDFGTPLSALLIFILAPLLMRVILDVQRMPQGELRDALISICRAHRVKVRELLLWRTGGMMINAAVMGLLRPVRYVLVTDGLIEAMSRRELLAVMAHEVGHVRRHHMPWLLITLMAILMVASIIVWLPLYTISQLDIVSAAMFKWSEVALTALAVAGSLLIFGWVSRRFERQADTFAVQHLVMADEHDRQSSEPADHGIITPDAAFAMTAALGRIAHIHFIDPGKPSWRHGSIAWRQQYLRSLIGRPVNALKIDRVVRRIKLCALLIVVSMVAADIAMRVQEYNGYSPVPEPDMLDFQPLELQFHDASTDLH